MAETSTPARVVYVNISLDPRDGTQANSNGAITDPEILAQALAVHDYLTHRALYGHTG